MAIQFKHHYQTDDLIGTGAIKFRHYSVSEPKKDYTVTIYFDDNAQSGEGIFVNGTYVDANTPTPFDITASEIVFSTMASVDTLAPDLDRPELTSYVFSIETLDASGNREIIGGVDGDNPSLTYIPTADITIEIVVLEMEIIDPEVPL